MIGCECCMMTSDKNPCPQAHAEGLLLEPRPRYQVGLTGHFAWQQGERTNC